ncbi:uncharacterized protein LOC127949338 [Carassius gibelio]|uniref:uncharacterized protein LOC127949338 n=1 Tax=Carassius gibelio TaxID=101364 RepID=UPI002279C8CA|nr:uncharacterized protein LOC127949338 [Carassius gibelio]
MKVKMLAVLALVLLVSSATEGRILSKCELKSQLEAALGGNQGGNGSATLTNGPGNVTVPENVTVPKNVTVPGNTTVPDNTTANPLIAQIVCSVEHVSKFDTSLVTTIQEDPRSPVRPPVRPPPRPEQRPNERPGGRPGRPGGRGKRSHGAAHGHHSSESSESSEEKVITRLFGIFQLSDRVACDSGSGQSLNICNMSCRALTDDDIRDDITCLKTLLDSARNAPVSVFASPPKKTPLVVLSVNECRGVNPAQYFAECP